MNYSLDETLKMLKTYNLELVDKNISNITGNTKLLCCDDFGYYIYIRLYPLTARGTLGEKVHKSNDYSIQNINNFLKIRHCTFRCVSTKYISRDEKLDFICLHCNEHVESTWHKVGKTDNFNRQHILCPNCGSRNESLHALILKQMFLHYYPDTVCEEKSCTNTITGKIMPTDIVNHSLKVAIEIQSEWHDNLYSKIKDFIKKNYWIEQGYKFYALDIRDYSILDMCKVFFDIEELPDFLNYNYGNKLNIKEIQKLLDMNYSIPEISSMTKVNIHRIYDAIYSKKIFVPSKYVSPDKTQVVQFDMEGKYIREYSSISEAARLNNIKATNIQSALNKKRHYSSNYIWYYKKDYNDAKVVPVDSRFSKYYIPVDKYDLSGNFIQSYKTIIDAAKDSNTTNSVIFYIISNRKNHKSVNGFTFKKH